MAKRTDGKTSGNGAVTPFGNGRGGVDQSQSGAHDFVKNPTSDQNKGGGRDFTRESRPQPGSPSSTNPSPYLEGRPQRSEGGAAARTNPRDAGQGGVTAMPPGAGAATNFDSQQGQQGAPVQRPPFKNLK